MKKNILVVGVGGQGVISLGKIIAIASRLSGYDVIGSENKGGAQRWGAVSTLIRLYHNEKKYSVSTRLESGQADIVFSLDLIETMRHQLSYSSKTVIISDKNAIIPPLIRASGMEEVLRFNEIEQAVGKYTGHAYIKDFSLMSKRYFNDKINTGIIQLYWSLKKGLLTDIEKAAVLEATGIVMDVNCLKNAKKYLME